MSETDVLIIGGGIAGASCAYHLADSDVGDVVLVEKSQPASGATGRSAGFITPYQFLGTGIHADVTDYCISFFEDLENRSDRFDLHYRDAFTFAREEESVQYVRQLHEETGWPSELLTGESLAERISPIDPSEIEAAVAFEDGMFVDPHSAATTILDEAEDRGVSTELSAVTGIEPVDGGTVVTTENTEYRAEHVVVAAGAWSKDLTADLDLSFPLKPRISQIAMVRTQERVELPLVNDPDLDLYYRTEVDGDVLIGGGIHKEEIDPVSFGERATEAFLQEVSVKAGRITGDLDRGKIASSWAGLCSATPDRYPLVGETDVEGVYLCCGFNGEGIMYAPMAGRIVADVVTNTETPFDREPYDPRRYDEEFDFEIKSALEW